jgi:hypothetical protein
MIVNLLLWFSPRAMLEAQDTLEGGAKHGKILKKSRRGAKLISSIQSEPQKRARGRRDQQQNVLLIINHLLAVNEMFYFQ